MIKRWVPLTLWTPLTICSPMALAFFVPELIAGIGKVASLYYSKYQSEKS